MNKHDQIKSELELHNEYGQRKFDSIAMVKYVFRNWYWIIVSLVITMTGASLYLGHTLPVYNTSSIILIKETGERQLVNNDELLQGLGLPGGLQNIENQIQILTSRSITERALRELPFEVEYYRKTFRNKLPFYPDIPIKIVTDGEITLPRNNEFSITWLDSNTFYLQSENDNFRYEQKGSFGETIEIGNSKFRVSLIDQKWFSENPDEKIYFVVNSDVRLVSYYNGRIIVDQITRGGTMLRVSISGTNQSKDADYLNKHIEIFQSLSLERKNIEADRRVQFIDEQLVGIADSLLVTENRLQQFRSSNRLMDISSQGQAIIGQMTVLENERARLKLESDYYDYLSDYLAKDVSAELPIVPITMGITDPGLTRLVTELADLQSQLVSRGAGDLNPIQNLLAQRVRNAKDALLETLNGLRRANNLAMVENQERIDRINAQASALPITERQLLGFERKFRLNDELYTFLLETRAEQQMQKASNTANSEVIEPADTDYSHQIAPSPLKVYFAGVFLGFGIPLLVLFLTFTFNDKLCEDDLNLIRNIPIVGRIPHNNTKVKTPVFSNPNSGMAESYRMLRSKLQFYSKDKMSKITLVTSSMPVDGKTFTAINLASVYSLLGSKTIIVGFDLRKPRLYQELKLKNERGVSTYLIGEDNLDNIIQKTEFNNLSVITAGPVPPNPSELIALDKTRELLISLKERYENIILDSPPVGFISDTVQIAKLADICLLVTRPGHTIKYMLYNALREVEAHRIKNVSLLLNDVKVKYNLYGDKYGYTKRST